MGNRTSTEERGTVDAECAAAASVFERAYAAALAAEVLGAAVDARAEAAPPPPRRLRAPPFASEPLLCGWLDKFGEAARTWRRRFCVCTPDGILAYYDRDADRGAPRGTVSLLGYAVVPEAAVRGDDARAGADPAVRLVAVLGGRRDYLFRCSSSDERDAWCAALRCAARAGSPPLSAQPLAAPAFRRALDCVRRERGLAAAPGHHAIDRREADALAVVLAQACEEHARLSAGAASAADAWDAATRRHVARVARDAAASAWAAAAGRADALRDPLERLLASQTAAAASAVGARVAEAAGVAAAAAGGTERVGAWAAAAAADAVAALGPRLCWVR